MLPEGKQERDALLRKRTGEEERKRRRDRKEPHPCAEQALLAVFRRGDRRHDDEEAGRDERDGNIDRRRLERGKVEAVHAVCPDKEQRVREQGDRSPEDAGLFCPPRGCERHDEAHERHDDRREQHERREKTEDMPCDLARRPRKDDGDVREELLHAREEEAEQGIVQPRISEIIGRFEPCGLVPDESQKQPARREHEEQDGEETVLARLDGRFLFILFIDFGRLFRVRLGEFVTLFGAFGRLFKFCIGQIHRRSSLDLKVVLLIWSFVSNCIITRNAATVNYISLFSEHIRR